MATVYVKLLDEGMDVWRPVPAARQATTATALALLTITSRHANRGRFLPVPRLNAKPAS